MLKTSRVASRLSLLVTVAIVVAVGAAAGTVSVAPRSTQVATAAGVPIGFEVPRVTDPIHTYGEPDIAISSADAESEFNYVVDPSNATTGNVSVSGPAGTGVQRSIWEASVDGGHTFRTITRDSQIADLLQGAFPLSGAQLVAPGGGDTEIKYDHTGKQYFADLWALACQHTATREVNLDGTENTLEAPAGGCNNLNLQGSDRQWIVVKDHYLSPVPELAPPVDQGSTPPLVYMEYNDLTGAQWMRSTDGLTYVNAQADGVGGGAASLGGYNPFGADGVPTIDQVTGKVFEASFASNDTIHLNIGTPINANGDLCFLDPAPSSELCPETSGLITVATGRHNDSGAVASFMVTSLDMARNLWVAWVDSSSTDAEDQTYVAVSPPGDNNCWCTFSPAIQVSSPPSQVGIFPWIQAGAAGIADVVWYGSDTLANPSTKSGQKWDVYMSQVKWPLATEDIPAAQQGNVLVQTQNVDINATPAIEQVKVTPHPMKFDDICLSGTGCILSQGNRNLADFFEIHTDRTGAAMIVYDDAGNPYVELAPADIEGLSHIGTPIVTVARQSSGPGLLGTNVSGPSNAPVSGLDDAGHDGLFPVFGGDDIPGMDILGNHMSTSGQTLTLTTKIAVNDPLGALTQIKCPTCLLQYVTRWQMGNHVYYGMYETDASGLTANYYAGEVQVVDDCSVSACDPHIVVYPELPPNGHIESGHIDCPASPSAEDPCTITEEINLADIGGPTNDSLLEEVGSYALYSLVPMSLVNQAGARVDTVPNQVDGVCCYNFGAAGVVAPPPSPEASPSPDTTLPNTSTGGGGPGLAALLVFLVGLPLAADEWRRRRRARRAASS
ncbi:MAG: hypothetical protein QOE92_999 [Chloroflexota bacterium]|jgi:hypothetical protein|nr:hypothetical protein [Chloroflexota bacterium]